MNQFLILTGILYVFVGAVSIAMSPDPFSLAVTAIMLLVVLAGYLLGMIPSALFTAGFRKGRKNLRDIAAVQSNSTWMVAQNAEVVFGQKTLDQLYRDYVTHVKQQEEEGLIPRDIEEVINEDSLALRSWQPVIHQIPGSLTALGLLGTFIGLVTGISQIGFSSVDAALSSIEVLLSGIRTAFFTSIVGVIFSLLFNLLFKLIWNMMLREMGLFMEQFHLDILPSNSELANAKHESELSKILDRMDRIALLNGGTPSNGTKTRTGDDDTEARIMPEIRAGLKKGEFIFHVQPRCDLNTRRITGGEALVRWHHGDLGIVSPSAFLAVVEKNGFIVRIDRYLWESVCQALQRRIRENKMLIPISVNVSKTDILVMDVAEYMISLVKQYEIPPRYLEIEISEAAYVQCEAEAREVEYKLRRAGFRVMADGFSGDFVSISTLRHCDIDAVKMDLRFFSGKDPDQLRSAFDQAKGIGKPIIAVGIENAEHLSILRRCACNEGQGYFLYRPMTVNDFEDAVDQE